MMDPVISKSVAKGNAYFTVCWSVLRQADKFDILNSVPSVSGIFELYFVDRNRTLNYIDVYRAWYGGLRNTLRELTDPLVARIPGLRDLAKRKLLVYRYSLSNSNADMADIIYFFRESKRGAASGESRPEIAGMKSEPMDPSGRYRYVYVNETSPDKLVTI